MTLLASWFLFLIFSVCKAQDDAFMEGSGEGSGEDPERANQEPVNPGLTSPEFGLANHRKAPIIQQIDDNNEAIETTIVTSTKYIFLKRHQTLIV
ncbi:unnamed protein product [Gongylonema pulchrum]|uniref:Secreted protein n=1 Tax=Gongylonema pulchrum TaxID=637853 RepID=A0A183DCM3_9BILA|nr:unnamed protein product [Gongylonema pulchrum]